MNKLRLTGIMNIKRIIPFFFFVTILISVSFTPVSASSLPEVVPDKGLVIFYRMSSFKGGAIRFNLNHSEGNIGQLLSGTYLYKHLAPGEHTFWSQAISQDSITLNVEAGKKYYVRGEVMMGVFAGRPKFTQVTESDALVDLEKLK